MIRMLLLFLVLTVLSAAAKRPNIVFLLADDQATYSVGCYGNPDVRTPHMDSLARLLRLSMGYRGPKELANHPKPTHSERA